MNAQRPSLYRLAHLWLVVLAISACSGAREAKPNLDAEGDASASATGAGTVDSVVGAPGGPVDDVFDQLRLAAPARDPVDLARRMGRIEGSLDPGSPESKPDYALGTVETFWLHDITQQRYFEVEARIEAIRDSAYFWVQTDQRFDAAAIERGADGFDQIVYPAVREVYGQEWSPGIDGDPRLHILHHQPVSGIAGYFYSVDEYPRSVEPHSNEREMFYINLSVYTPGSYDYLALLAHELQHMIHWNQDSNEAVWANEGLSELSAEIAGYRGQNGASFFDRPDTALLEWEAESGANAVNYAASYAFMAWFRARFGDAGIRAFVEAQPDGPAGIEAALASLGETMDFDAVFLDWTAANAMPPDVRRGRSAFDYGSSNVSRSEWAEWPAEGIADTVGQYASDVYEVTPAVREGQLALDFTGELEVGLLEAAPIDDAPVLWSQRGDNIDSHLTLPLDLRQAEQAALRFRLWHAIEEHWDYGYYRVSSDGGETWQALATAATTDENPNGNNFGAGVTGEGRGWTDERLDLEAYVGQEILLRWELVTDDAVNLEGMAIAELVLESDTDETPIALTEDRWQSVGWQLVPQVLPQRWGLQVLGFGSRGLQIWRPEVDRIGRAEIRLADIPDDATVILTVSGLTPATRQPTGYDLAPATASD